MAHNPLFYICISLSAAFGKCLRHFSFRFISCFVSSLWDMLSAHLTKLDRSALTGCISEHLVWLKQLSSKKPKQGYLCSGLQNKNIDSFCTVSSTVDLLSNFPFRNWLHCWPMAISIPVYYHSICIKYLPYWPLSKCCDITAGLSVWSQTIFEEVQYKNL